MGCGNAFDGLVVDLGVCCPGKFFENRVLENTFSGILGPKTLISGMTKTVNVRCLELMTDVKPCRVTVKVRQL